MIPIFLLDYLQSFSPFDCLFSLLIWHHERGLGLVIEITDSGARLLLLLLLCLLFTNIMASVASLYTCIALTVPPTLFFFFLFVALPLAHVPSYTFSPRFFFYPFPGFLLLFWCVCMIVIGWLSLDTSFFLPFFIVWLEIQIWILLR